MRQIFMALFCISLTVNALAADVTKNSAARVATNYFSEVLISNEMNRSAVISEEFNITKDGNTVLYIFNFENGGFVIVSADDRFTPVLGYSPDGRYEAGNMPGGFEYFIYEFSEMIAFIREKNIAAEPEYTTKWERFSSDQPTRGTAGTPVVGPLTALWNQDSPYNYYAPAVGGPGGKAYAGCVATAMSMIMYYWRWPWQGTGKMLPYRPNPCKGQTMDTLSANFGATFYDYNGMYGTSEITADSYLYEPIALLQYHAAIAVKMNFCSDGSGAQSTDVPKAMKDYFKYDPSIQHKQKGSMSTAEWAAMLKEQLNMNPPQPVYASGCGDGCHAFVCDGYDTDNMFHYNLGWSGSGNAYYVADRPNEFVTSTAAVINFKPDRSKGYPGNCSGNWTIPYMKGMIADCSGPEKYAAGITATWLIDPSSVGDIVESITISCNEVKLASGDWLRIYNGETDSDPLLGEYTGNTSFEPLQGGSKVLVKFTSAVGSPTDEGFLITYEAKQTSFCDPNTTITLTAASDVFTDGSPEDMNYTSSSNCRWYIFPAGAVDPETEILFQFNRLDTEKGGDLIKFYDYEKNKLVETISGTYALHELPQISIKTKKVMITFSSNSYANGKGFELMYDTYPVSIKEIENINDLTIYPNPASDKVNVTFNTSTPDNFDITIYNVTGQVVYKETLNNFIGSYHNELNIADFAQGVYLMTIKSSKGAATRKVVIQ